MTYVPVTRPAERNGNPTNKIDSKWKTGGGFMRPLGMIKTAVQGLDYASNMKHVLWRGQKI